MGLIATIVNIPQPPDKFSNLEEVQEYLQDLSTIIHDQLSELTDEFNGKIEIPNIRIKDTDAISFGEEINDSWRIIRSGNNFSFQRREAGAWVQKGVFTP